MSDIPTSALSSDVVPLGCDAAASSLHSLPGHQRRTQKSGAGTQARRYHTRRVRPGEQGRELLGRQPREQTVAAADPPAQHDEVRVEYGDTRAQRVRDADAAEATILRASGCPAAAIMVIMRQSRPPLPSTSAYRRSTPRPEANVSRLPVHSGSTADATSNSPSPIASPRRPVRHSPPTTSVLEMPVPHET